MEGLLRINVHSVESVSWYHHACVNDAMIFLLDLSGAFDTADLDPLLQRLMHVLRIKGAVLGWWFTLIRLQFVHVQGSFTLLGHG